MLMTAGDKDSLNVTAQCPPAVHFSHQSGFLQRADIPLRTSTLLGIGNQNVSTMSTLHSLPFPLLYPTPPIQENFANKEVAFYKSSGVNLIFLPLDFTHCSECIWFSEQDVTVRISMKKM